MEGKSKKRMLSEESGSEFSWLRQVYKISMALSMKTGSFLFFFSLFQRCSIARLIGKTYTDSKAGFFTILPFVNFPLI